MGKIRELWKKVCFEIKMRELDEQWRMRFGYCFEMYPPSFYYRHTPEEQKGIWERDFKKLREMIAGLDK